MSVSDLNATIKFTDGDHFCILTLNNGSFAVLGYVTEAMRDDVIARLVSWSAQIARIEGFNRK